MVRKQVYVTRRQDAALKARAQRERRPEAEIVREALDRLLDAPAPSRDAALARLDRLRQTVPPGQVPPWTRDALYDR